MTLRPKQRQLLVRICKGFRPLAWELHGGELITARSLVRRGLAAWPPTGLEPTLAGIKSLRLKCEACDG